MPSDLHGLLNLKKPVGPTSMQMVERVRRITGQRRAGHAGTLDPAATGVLPIGLGAATRVLEFFDELTKEYRLTIELGVITNTYDAEGTVIERRDPSGITAEQVASVLPQFRGTVRQLPPMFSALKHQGVPLYKLARQGIEVPRAERTVVIHRLELVGWDPPYVELEAECGRGVYLRTLAHDIGQALGCGAYLKGLVRLRSGPFRFEEAVTLEELAEAVQQGRAAETLFPLDEPLLAWDALILSARSAAEVRHGQSIPFVPPPRMGPPLDWIGRRARAYDPQGQLVALVRYQPSQGGWRPFKVFAPAEGDPPRSTLNAEGGLNRL